MKNDARLFKLRQKIGGNREIMCHDFFCGTPKEQQYHITPVNKNIRRIIGQLEFALKLDEANGGKYSSFISEALDIIDASLEAEGVLTASACELAEKAIMPISDVAKEYSLILCAHAHIDMNWMWGWNETVAATLSTFRTMLNLMKEYPTFTFSQSQTSIYRLVEEYDPDMMEEIKARIAEGRWEITASSWVETDKNMPTGESLINTIKYTRDYLEKVWGVDPQSLNIDFSPDTFGHSAHIPEIDTYGGVKYYYHCRGLEGETVLYNYRAPSGTEILMYREPYWYNSIISSHIGVGLVDISRRMGGLKTGLIVYGVGNHGGGATRRDVERAIEMMDWPVFPNVRFGSFHEFFEIADKPEIRAAIPTVDKELNFLFDGCYTTQTRIKRANRMAEAKLNEAQYFASLSSEYLKGRYNARAFEAAWQNVVFNHFHDILTGSNVQDSREYALGLFQKALAHAETEENISLSKLSDSIDSSMVVSDVVYDSRSEGAGSGYGIGYFTGVPNPERGVGITRVYNIFNSTAAEREDLCELTMWDWVGDIRCIQVTDTAGNPMEFALIDSEPQVYWDHSYLRLLVKCKLPPFGYTTVVIGERDFESYPFYYGPTNNILTFENEYVLENENIRAVFDLNSMSLVSLIDKADGSEKIGSGMYAGLVQIDSQLQGGSAWEIGTHHQVRPVDDIRRVDRFVYGALRQGYRYDARILNSDVRVEITLDAGAKALNYHVSVDWNETAGRFAPLLALRMPAGYAVQNALCDVPMGVVYRKSEAHDIPALTYTAAIGEGNPLYLMADSKYGYRLLDDVLYTTLINTSHNPDPTPERGHHEINIAVGVGSNCSAGMAKLSERYNHPLRAISTNPHKGSLAPEGALMQAELGTARITSVTRNGEKLLVRVNELCGKASEIKFGFLKPVKSARLTDLLGNTVGECDIDNEVKFEVKPYGITSVEIGF